MDLLTYLKQSEIDFTLSKKGEITVGGGLYLTGCTGITQLPDRLTVGGWLDLHEGINNVTYKHNCGRERRRIFAAWVNGEIQISAGCFLGAMGEFCTAVDDKYSGAAAEEYKADAQECVDSLVAKLNLRLQ